MMRSLYSGVSGLKIHQTRMDVIGNNIANVNTVGFKSQTVNFSELFYQTTQSASGPNAETQTGGQNAKQIGLGASVSTISTNITAEGGSQTTGNAFDLKINGGSFFVVQSAGANYYTKAGNFTTDGFGNLVTTTGAFVMGYTAARNESGDFELMTDELRPISIYGNQYQNTDPAQTTNATMLGNINSEDDRFASETTPYITTTLSAYDSLGNLYTVMFRVDNNATDPTLYNLTPMSVYRNNQKMDELAAVMSGTATSSITVDAGTPEEQTLTGVALEFSGETGYVINTDKEFTLDIIDTNTNANLESFPQSLTINFSELKCMASETKLQVDRGDADNFGMGKAVGKMISVGIQTDGKITASYDNGDTTVIGQVMVSSFVNPAGLEKVGDNMFATTLNSGEPVISDISANGESMSSGTLEMSNVDLADEFTSMIVTQRGYQANSRIITTSDTMIEELLSLKR